MIRLSSSFVRTLREDPADAEVASHRLLVRAGYIRRSAAGVYTWLPLGLRVLRKVEQIVREEQDAIGGQEVLFSALQPREPYEATGRWEDYGPPCSGCRTGARTTTSSLPRTRRCSPSR